MAVTREKTSGSRFHKLLRDQVRHEFTSAQQLLAIAVWFDARDLPRLASRFYGEALAGRNRAMMIVAYLHDVGVDVAVPGIDSVHNEFGGVREPVALALEQERASTAELTALAKVAREEGDLLGEQFLQWFLADQVARNARMSSLRHVVERAGDDLFALERFLAREHLHGDEGPPDGAPRVAGGWVRRHTGHHARLAAADHQGRHD
ncbi:Ferritin [Streptoalloteichus tenebrarius]|uniref:Ferritin n=1 Tax=Streptoalloteichus tenebrarius (strain ATCC 17920 / DSM 40477 / JCM 4838 / CBS 697.72 / NBRC 16177 / NCIMB 11028 / NRRL B-12390 / A12253. 1 / ISP 5477) TaxID=1933 RepID=A0ABT1HU71_STRSD|nr:ferritin [Streptoalloteichus tenebrarius]MCP2259069.1 Ferritin [Streptoalloteichus tenebrarius]BFE99604.1 ferritin [Streptoalloteichus tenebrarius]